MNKIIKLGFLFITFLFFSNLNAQQNPINVSVVVTPPFPQYVSNYMGVSKQVVITLQNTDFGNTHKIKLVTSLIGDNGVEIIMHPDKDPLQAISLKRGEVKTITGNEIVHIYENYARKDFTFKGVVPEELYRSQRLPEGNYRLCMRAYAYNTTTPLSQGEPIGCSQMIPIRLMDPPIITYPLHNSNVFTSTPQAVNFAWTPVSYNIPSLRYRLKLIDITNINVNLYEAMESQNFLYYQEEDLIANNLFYGISKPVLEEGHQFAVQVQAYDVGGQQLFKNDGKSEIVVFNYGSDTLETDTTGQTAGTGDGDTSTQQTTTQSSPPGNFSCAGGCDYDLAAADQTPATAFQNGDILQIGHFELRITQAAWNGNLLNGEGVILAGEFLLAPVKVLLKDIKVNANGRVFGGHAQAKNRIDSWLGDNDDWADDEGEIDLDDLLPNKSLKEMYEDLTSSEFYMDKLTAFMKQQGVTLPLGYGGGPYKLQIVGMHFYPEKATYNLFSMVPVPDDKDEEKFLTFGSKGLCINPAGPATSEDQSFLYLTNDVDVNFSEKVGLRILQGNVSSSQKDGTYLSFDCDGVHEVALGGLVVFSNDILIAEDQAGTTYESDTVSGWFQTKFSDWGDWIATIDFQNLPSSASGNYKKGHYFQYAKLENYTFSVANAVFDHSDINNPPGMTFPKSYTGPDKDDPGWQGVYFQSLGLRLPRFVKSNSTTDERIKIDAQNILVDNSGFSGYLKAGKILKKNEGSVGGWMFTIDSLELSVVQNAFELGKMRGGLKLPITDSLVDYYADIDYSGNQTKHLFHFETNEVLDAPMWAAELNIDPNSTLHLQINGNQVTIVATLHGNLSFADEIDGIPGMNLKSIDFQDLELKNGAPYISVGYVGSNGNLTTPAVAGFAIALKGIDYLLSNNADIGRLSFDVDMDFTGNTNALSAGTRFALLNKFDFNAEPWEASLDGAEIEEISLAGDLGAVKIDGRIEFFKQDPEFGKGFEGELTATFAKSIQVEAQALFGNSEVNNQNLKYWFVSAKALFVNTPLPLVTPVDCYGFGGGAYYNLGQKTVPPAKDLDNGGNTNLRSNFEIDKGNLGLQATIVIGLTPEPMTFNADVTLKAELNTNTWGISMLSLEGDSYIMAPILDRSSAMVESSVSVTYDFVEEIFDLKAGIVYNVPPGDPKFTMDGNLHLHRDKDTWFFKSGEPSDRISGDLNLGKVTATLSGYFMMGENLPAPTLPAKVESFLSNYTPSFPGAGAISSGMGFAAGAKIEVEVNDINLIVCRLDINGIAGADVSVFDYSNMTCSGKTDFGVNRWYANGQAYLYVDATFRIKEFKVFACTLGAVVEAGVPNPTGVKGMAKASFTFLGKDIDVEKSFTVGSICNMEPVTVDGEPKIQPLPIEGLTFIKEITPKDEAKQVSLLVEPTIKYSHDVSDYNSFELTYNDGMGNAVTTKYRLYASSKWTFDDGMDHEYHTEYDEEDYITTFTPTTHRTEETRRMLAGNSRYKVTATVTVEKQDSSGSWIPVKYNSGNNAGEVIEEKKTHYFTTEEVPTYIEDFTVNFTKPYDRQRYFTQSDLGLGVIAFSLDNEIMFDSLQARGYKLYAQFNPVGGGGSHGKTEINLDYDLKAYFEIPDLDPETVYECRVIGIKELNSTVGGNSTQSGSTTTYGTSGGMTMANYTYNQSGSINQQLLQNNTSQNVMGVNGTNITLASVIEIYKIHFRTSKYNSMNDKINSMNLANSNTATYGSNWPWFTNLTTFDEYEVAILTLSGGERFDVYDIFGGDTLYGGSFTGPALTIRDGYSGSDCSSMPNDWFQDICLEIYNWNTGGVSPPPGSGNGPPGPLQQQFEDFLKVLESINYNPEIYHSYNYFNGYTHIDEELTDWECGITTGSGPVAYTLPLVIGNEVMKFTWMGELDAKEDFEELQSNPLSSIYDGTYPPITSGDYPFHVKNTYMSNDNQKVPNPVDKIFNTVLNF